MNELRHAEYVKTLPEAITNALEADYTNGMATAAFTVERERCYLKVIRKCGSDTHPEILLFKCVPKNGQEPDRSKLSDHITEALNFYGDVSVTFSDDSIPTAVVGTDML